MVSSANWVILISVFSKKIPFISAVFLILVDSVSAARMKR